MLLIMIVTKLVRGPGGGAESIFGLDICDVGAWIAFAVLVILAVILTIIASRVSSREYAEKLDAGYHFTKGDQ